MTNAMHYAAVLDGDIEGADLRDTRAAAEKDAVWLRGHPARRDRVRYGQGGHVAVRRVVVDEWTGDLIDADADADAA